MGMTSTPIRFRASGANAPAVPLPHAAMTRRGRVIFVREVETI